MGDKRGSGKGVVTKAWHQTGTDWGGWGGKGPFKRWPVYHAERKLIGINVLPPSGGKTRLFSRVFENGGGKMSMTKRGV